MKRSAALACLLASVAFSSGTNLARAEADAKAAGGKSALELRIDRAVKKAVEWFRGTQNRGKGKDGAWSFREPYWESGMTSLAIFSMLKAGVDKNDPMIKAGFQYIAENVTAGARPTEMYTYNVVAQMLAIEAAYREMLKTRSPQNPGEKALLAIFEANFDYCQKALKNGEAGYTHDQMGIDMSNTQFVVMGLEAAHRAGYKLSSRLWYDILRRCMEIQAADGPAVNQVNILSNRGDEVDKHGYIIRDRYGWLTGKPAKARGWTYGDFFKKDEIYGSMTCAGVANLLSCLFVLENEEEFKKNYEKSFQNALRDGFAWLQKYYAVNANPAEPSFWSQGRLYKGDTFWTYYYLFTLARITTATNIRFIGNRNWYEEGADFLLKAQRPEGNWDQVVHETHNFKSDCIPIVNTAFALWFFSSLDHSRTGDPEAEAATIREGGKPPKDMNEFEQKTFKLMMDVHRDEERWDVDSPLDGTADLVYGLSVHPVYDRAKEEAKVKEGLANLLKNVIPSEQAMEQALKNVKATDTMSTYYEKHLLYERWRTKTICRTILAAAGSSATDKDWEKAAADKAQVKIKPGAAAKAAISSLEKHLVSHAIKVGRDQLAWSDSCGRPTVLQPDSLNTAFALRALYAAGLCGASQQSAVWKAAAKFLISTQEEKGPETDAAGPDGKPSGKKVKALGFGVTPGDRAQLDVTLEVMSALHLCLEEAKAAGALKKEIDEAIESGWAWLTLHFKGYSDFGILAAARRLGTLSGRTHIGQLDWNQEGLKFIGFQDESRGYLSPDCSRKIAFTFYFLSTRFLV